MPRTTRSQTRGLSQPAAVPAPAPAAPAKGRRTKTAAAEKATASKPTTAPKKASSAKPTVRSRSKAPKSKTPAPVPESDSETESDGVDEPRSFEDQIKPLREAISEKPPFCSGTCIMSPNDFTLFYGKEDGISGRLNLSRATTDQLDALAQVCDPATFGRGQADVLDESYRKAGKLDVPNFSMPFDLAHAGILDVVRAALLEGHDDAKAIRAELYKLNVYGEGAFFKAHKDTPRGDRMFGSLVLVFPTPHEGGVLFIRQGDNEWTFDSAREIAEADVPSLAYVAFYSDVEHEVSVVETGHRVTLTYNLHFAEETTTPQLLPENVVPTISSTELAFTSVLKTLLADKYFLRTGGRLAFGLRHQYSIRADTSLVETQDRLKGADAEINRACMRLGLRVSLKLMYAQDPEYTNEPCLVMLDGVPDTGRWNQIEDDIADVLVEECGGEKVARPDHGMALPGDEDERDIDSVRWVTDLTEYSTVKSQYAAYGNEATVDCVYGNACLLVEVGKVGQRETA